MAVNEGILKEIMSLSPVQKADLVEKILSSLDKPDHEIDELWAKEAEERIDAYEQNKIKVIPLEKALEKYNNRRRNQFLVLF